MTRPNPAPIGTPSNARRRRRPGRATRLTARCIIVPIAVLSVVLTVHTLLLSTRLRVDDQDDALVALGGQRTAACFSGEVRTFARTWPSIKKHFLDRISMPYDVHLVFNDEEDRAKGLRVVSKDRSNRMGVYDSDRRDPFASEEGHEESDAERRRHRNFGAMGSLSDWTNFKGRTPSGSPEGYIYQLAGLESCLSLRRSVEAERGVRYTHAARLRYDTLFEGDLPPIDTVLGSMEVAGNGGVMVVPQMQSHDGINDKMAWGTVDALVVYQSQLRMVSRRGLPSDGGEWCDGTAAEISSPNTEGGEGDKDGMDGRGQKSPKRRLQPEACLEAYLKGRNIRVVPLDIRLRILREDGSFSET